MRIAEWIQIVFVCLLALAGWICPLALRRRVKVSALAGVVVTTITAVRFAGRLLPPSYLSVIRDWLPVAFFQIPFWQSGQFYVSPSQRLQERLTTFDQNFFEMVLRSRAGRRWGIGFSLYTEFAYLMCYLIVPLGVAVLYAAGMRYCVDHYWTIVMLAAYICYAVSPFVQALPPRTLVDDKMLGIPPSKVRELNQWILRHASIQVITFPSAHVAASVAASLVLFELVPWMGLVFACVAVSIAVAAVVGRYHYVADVLLGIRVAFLNLLCHALVLLARIFILGNETSRRVVRLELRRPAAEYDIRYRYGLTPAGFLAPQKFTVRASMMNNFRLKRRIRTFSFYVRQARVVAKALKSPRHPISAHIVPIRRCNLSCDYCNEYDSFSEAVPIAEMLRRVDRLAALGTTIITLSGGEPLLHPELDEIIRRIRSHGIIATLITNGYFLTPNRIKRLNAAGLDHLQISVDNVLPDEVSKKSLKVLDKKLQWLAQYAEFQVNINCVSGAPVHKPEDAVVIARRARELGLVTTVGIIHDGSGQLRRLSERHREAYEQVVSLGRKSFATFAYYNQFQKNLVRGLRNDWHCHAGSRYLYVCENGLVHYCSQQRGYPAIPLEDYTSEHLEREYGSVKPCAPFCTISCVHQVAMIDQLRENPVETLARFFPPAEPNAPFELPFGVSILAWFFPPESKGMPKGAARTLLAAAAMRILGIR